ncbi:MAG: D-alanine--D-alanine ligase [Actinomycetota bacterium]|nr:D-alanine--D-alanine ligase [Actinomycetota bacterium]
MALLYGGRSAEHEVSCVSARHVAAAIEPSKYEVVPVGITKDGRWVLPDVARTVLDGGPLKVPEETFEAEGSPITPLGRFSDEGAMSLTGIAPDVVFPVLHGPYGEDGTVQGLLELADVPYVGSGVLGSAVAMDKVMMKVAFRAAELPTAQFVVLRQQEWQRERGRLLEAAVSLGFPSFTKPANLGSSVGITRCTDRHSLARGIELAFEFDRKVVVEEGISGREIECAVLGNDSPEASVCGEILPGREFYDYTAKYLDPSSRTVVPADLPRAVSEEIRRHSLAAFRAVEAAGLSRVDFFYDAGGRGVVVNEINTMPGFTEISMFPKLWEATGIPYATLIDKLLELALERYASKPRPKVAGPGAL